jgi:hypothetical protein
VSDEQLADVLRMESVDILFRKNVADDRVGIDVPRQRHLHENAVHRGIRVEPLDQGKQFTLCRRCRKPDGVPGHPSGLRRLLLGADVRRARPVVADEHDGQAGHDAPRRQRGHVARDLVADGPGDGFAVDEFSAQSPPPGSRE